ncbi:MAG TPA: transcription factor S [Geobacterales bacterium]|nr:transcription factor S [Geobacterales bacterium]
MIKFCPKCGNLLKPEKNSNKLVCKVCGYFEFSDTKISLAITTSKQKKSKEIMIDEGEKDHRMPTAEVPCPKCGNELAYWWLVQTRRADEPPTTFYRCTKCGHTWRDYR